MTTEEESLDALAYQWKIDHLRKPRVERFRRPRRFRKPRRSPRQKRSERQIQFLLSPEATKAILDARTATGQTKRYCQEIVFEELRKHEAAAVDGLVRKIGHKMLAEAMAREAELAEKAERKATKEGKRGN